MQVAEGGRRGLEGAVDVLLEGRRWRRPAEEGIGIEVGEEGGDDFISGSCAAGRGIGMFFLQYVMGAGGDGGQW